MVILNLKGVCVVFFVKKQQISNLKQNQIQYTVKIMVNDSCKLYVVSCMLDVIWSFVLNI